MPARASEQDGSHPRPQLVRPGWTDLCGTWQLAFDDTGTGLDDHWAGLTDPGDRAVFDRDVVVPFPPESTASSCRRRSRSGRCRAGCWAAIRTKCRVPSGVWVGL